MEPGFGSRPAAPGGPAAEPRPGPSPGSHRRLRALAAAAAIAAFVLLTLPPPGLPAAPGIDGSFAWGLNALPGTGARHGRDVVFTYGPLGFVVAPLPVGGHVAAAAPVRLGVQLLLGLALAALAASGVSAARLGLFVAVQLTLFAFVTVTWEATATLAVPLLLAPDLAGRRAARWAAPLAGVLIALFALIKMSLAAISGLFALGWAVHRFAGRRERGVRPMWLAAAAFAGTFAAAAVVLFGDLGSLVAWLRGQVELVGRYGEAMSLDGAPGVVAAGAALALVPLGLALLARRRGEALAPLYGALVLPAWLLFRHGFVRPDVHVHFAVAPALGLLALALLLAPGRIELRRAVAGVAAAGLLGAAAIAAAGYHEGRDPAARLLGRAAVANLSGYLAPARYEARLRAASARLLAAEEWRGPVRESLERPRASFDAVPWNLAVLPANGLEARWRPNPALQLYAAFTPALDRRVARHFGSAAAPTYLLVHGDAIDGRQLLWEAPETWRAIELAYAPSGLAAPPGWLVLAARRGEARRTTRPLGRAALAAGEWLELPAVEPGEALAAAFTFAPTLGGRLAAALYRIAPVVAEVEYADGGARSWRLLPDNAGSGLRVDAPPRSTPELATLLAGEPAARARRLRLGGPGLASFRAPVAVELVAERLLVAQGLDRPLE